MASKFLTFIGKLRVLDFIPDHQLFQDPGWSLYKKQKLCQCCTKLLEYGKNNYWNGDKMTNQTVNLVAQIFLCVFSNYQALFAFDNTTNHAYFAKNALLVRKMNLGVGGKQSWIRNSFNDATQEIQPIVFPEDHYDVLFWGKFKRLK